MSPLAKYLILPDATPKSRVKTSQVIKVRAMTVAAVLSSAECFAIIKNRNRTRSSKGKKRLEKEKNEKENKTA